MRNGADAITDRPALRSLRITGLEPAPDRLHCRACDRCYPIAADVPVMFGDAVAARGPLLAPAVVRTVLRSMDLPAETGTALRIRRASGARARYGDRLVTVESAQFLRRVHASGYPIPVELLKTPMPAQEIEAGAQPRCRWLLDYIPRAMRPGQACLCNVRFENDGGAPMQATGLGRISIAFGWTDSEGAAVVSEDYRTPLPVDMAPGQALTLPIRLVVPAVPGEYSLTLRMVMEGVRWLQPEYGPLPITIRRGAAFAPPAHWHINANEPADYISDHIRGVELLRGWLGPPSRWAGLRLLEIGGNAKPVLGQFPGEGYNVDVDLLGLQVGWVAQRARARLSRRPAAAVSFVCADAHNLPFAENFFDAIIMFASLHHVPAPAVLLRQLRAHLRPGGFIGLFCEPIGHIWPGAVEASFAEELRHGVNEQGFSLAEYAQIFAAAGLQADALVADYNSLKARLLPVTAHV